MYIMSYLVLNSIQRSRFLDRSRPIRFSKLRKITLLAVKYCVNFIIKEAVARLETVFPVSYKSSYSFADNDYYTRSGGSAVLCTMADCIGAVNLARAISPQNPPIFIVTALYYCCQLSAESLFDGYNSTDEVVKLSNADLRLCGDASQRLLEANHHVKSVFVDMQDRAEESRHREHAFKRLVQALIRDKSFVYPEPLDSCESFLSKHRAEVDELCSRCTDRLKAELDDARHETFNELGDFFGIVPWPSYD